jgi:hypothetical protein
MRGSDAGPSAAHTGLRLGSIDDRIEGKIDHSHHSFSSTFRRVETAHRTPPVGVGSGCVTVSVGGASLKPVALSLQTDAIQEEHQLDPGVTAQRRGV